MGIEHMIIMAPLDPFFKPSYAMLDGLFQRLLNEEIAAHTFEEIHKARFPGSEEKGWTSFLDMWTPEPFPPNFTFPHPDQWTEETLALRQRIFECDDMYDPETDDYLSYYVDTDHLRQYRQRDPKCDENFKYEGDFKSGQYASIQSFLEGNYWIRAFAPLHPLMYQELASLGFHLSSGGSIRINCGFHCVENFLVVHEPETEELYFQCFPYAPKARWIKEHGLSPKNELLLTYAGSFSMSLYFNSTCPLFEVDSPLDFDGNPTWPEGFTAVDNVEQFRRESTYHKKLKAAMEDCFQTPVDVFVGVDL